ncbi:MAG TPA: hypothetical protein VM580_16750 [Labilithrix sp.]|nr:hypothetical protein [Labilithrix sp.]
MTTSGASRKVGEAANAIAAACSAAAVGFDLCARRTKDEKISVAASSAAKFLRYLVESTIAAAAARGIDARPRARTADRLRWEWLASTATVVDGVADGRLLAECARILAVVDAGPLPELGEGIAARFRVAAAEAYSLASAIQQMRRREAVVPGA